MTFTDFCILLGSIAGIFAAGLVLIQIWDSKAVRRQDKAHEQAKEISSLKEARVDSLFAGMASAMKQLQDQQRDMSKEYQAVSSDLKNHRVEVQSLQTVTKLEIEHIKAALQEIREEVKSVTKDIGEGWVRVSSPKKY
jgi:DNA anti-recombination protein RmuC